VPRRGEIVLARFPFTDQAGAKIRPVLVLAQLRGPYPDHLVMFISSQLGHATPDDVLLVPGDPAFARSGLKVASYFRFGNIATLSGSLLIGGIGELEPAIFDVLVERLVRLVRGS